MKPSPPLVHQPSKAVALDLSAFGGQLVETDRKKQQTYDASRKIQVALIKAKSELERNQPQDGKLDELLKSLVPDEASREPREANLSYRVEDYVCFKAYAYFLDCGRLIPPSDCQYATDEEYLGGALMGLCSDLARYGMGRATARDVESVQAARDLAQEIQNELLQFDFRNGHLRRKFDGTKYSLKTLETLLYELSVTGSILDSEEPAAKKLKMEILLPVDELGELRKRMEHRDDLREKLIKNCRDGQKAAKQTIFALHRGDRKKAGRLLAQCESCIRKDLLPIVTEEPPLRSGGSFMGVLEEYAEAKLFSVWLFGKDGSSKRGELLLPEDFEVPLSPEEYLGGLCDLTGEIGRFAVQRGTARDTDAVKLSLFTNSCILNAVQTLERLPGGTGKKMDQLRRSVEKIERMLYEMSLSEATGRKVSTSADAPETKGHNEAGE